MVRAGQGREVGIVILFWGAIIAVIVMGFRYMLYDYGDRSEPNVGPSDEFYYVDRTSNG